MNKNIILPCEIKSREFDAKLLLACILADRGWRVLFGSRNHLHMKLARLPRSIYLGKDVRVSSRLVVRIMQKLGHCFVALDEEALFFYSRQYYRDVRVNAEVLAAAQHLFAWGPENAAAWRESPDYKGTPITLTGHGRIDLMRPEFRALHTTAAEGLQQQHGRFILINTNFGALNHFYSHLNIMPEPTEGDVKAGSWGWQLAKHKHEVFRSFLAMVPNLAANFPHIKFILRPHPAENLEVWRTAVKTCSNVEVIGQGNVLSWVLASECLIHNGCTTGLEAYVLNALPIAYQAVRSEAHDLHLPNELSLVAKDDAQLHDMVKKVWSGQLKHGDQQSAERDRLLSKFIVSTEGPLASERMADVLDAIVAENHSRVVPSLLKRFSGMLHAEGRAMVKRINMRRPNHKTSAAYTAHRFPDTTVEQLRQRIAEFRPLMGLHNQIEAIETSPNIFEIRAVASSEAT